MFPNDRKKGSRISSFNIKETNFTSFVGWLSNTKYRMKSVCFSRFITKLLFFLSLSVSILITYSLKKHFSSIGTLNDQSVYIHTWNTSLMNAKRYVRHRFVLISLWEINSSVEKSFHDWLVFVCWLTHNYYFQLLFFLKGIFYRETSSIDRDVTRIFALILLNAQRNYENAFCFFHHRWFDEKKKGTTGDCFVWVNNDIIRKETIKVRIIAVLIWIRTCNRHILNYSIEICPENLPVDIWLVNGCRRLLLVLYSSDDRSSRNLIIIWMKLTSIQNSCTKYQAKLLEIDLAFSNTLECRNYF